MSAQPSASNRAFTSRLAHCFGAIADSLDWDQSHWVALCSQLQRIRCDPGELTLTEIHVALLECSPLGTAQ